MKEDNPFVNIIEREKQRGEHLKAYEWQSGQSGNPNGRPKGPTLTTRLKQRLADHPEEAEALIDSLVKMGLAREIGAHHLIWDRHDGKVVERHKIEGELPVKLMFVPARVLLEEPQNGNLGALEQKEGEYYAIEQGQEQREDAEG